jgi:HTH-type transcriptional regulator/antitoxin HigA
MKNSLKPIRTGADYAAAQRRVAALLLSNPVLGSPQSDELDVLGTLINAYDNEHFPVGAADPIAAIEFAMDQRGMAPKDLAPYLGTRLRVTEVLNGKRNLSLEQISRLHHGLGIPLACLIPTASDISRHSKAVANCHSASTRGREDSPVPAQDTIR